MPSLIVGIDARNAAAGAAQAERELQRVSVAAGKVDQSLTKANEKIDATGKVSAAAATGIGSLVAKIGAVVTIGAAVNEVVKFEAAVSKLASLRGLEGLPSQFKAIEQEAVRLGQVTRAGTSAAVAGLTEASRSGFDIAASQRIVAQSADLARASHESLGRASDATSKTLRAFGLDASRSAQVTSVLATSSEGSAEGLAAFLAVAQKVGPTARALGIGIEQVAAAYQLLDDNGKPAADITRDLLGIINDLARPSTEAAQEAARLGVRVADLDVKSKGLVGVFQTLGRANLDLASAQKIFSSGSAETAVILAQQAREFGNLAVEARSTTAAQQASAIAESTLADKFSSLKTAVSDLTLATGSRGLVGVLKEVTETGTELVQFLGQGATGFSDLSTGAKAAVVALSGLAALQISKYILGLEASLGLATIANTAFTSSLVASGAAQARAAIATRALTNEVVAYNFATLGATSNTLTFTTYTRSLTFAAEGLGPALGLAFGSIAVSIGAGVAILKEFDDNFKRIEERAAKFDKSDTRAKDLQELLTSIQSPTLTGVGGVKIETGSLLPDDKQLSDSLRSKLTKLRGTLSQEIEATFAANADPDRIVSGQVTGKIREQILEVLQQIPKEAPAVADAFGNRFNDTLAGVLASSGLQDLASTPQLKDALDKLFPEGGAEKALRTANGIDATTEALRRLQQVEQETARIQQQEQEQLAGARGFDELIAKLQFRIALQDQSSESVQRAAQLQQAYDLALAKFGGDTQKAGEAFSQFVKLLEEAEAATKAAEAASNEAAAKAAGDAALIARRDAELAASLEAVRQATAELEQRRSAVARSPTSSADAAAIEREAEIQRQLRAFDESTKGLSIEARTKAHADFERQLREVTAQEVAYKTQVEAVEKAEKEHERTLEEQKKRLEDLAGAVIDPLGTALDSLIEKLVEGELEWQTFADVAKTALQDIAKGVFSELVTKPLTKDATEGLAGLLGGLGFGSDKGTDTSGVEAAAQAAGLAGGGAAGNGNTIAIQAQVVNVSGPINSSGGAGGSGGGGLGGFLPAAVSAGLGAPSNGGNGVQPGSTSGSGSSSQSNQNGSNLLQSGLKAGLDQIPFGDLFNVFGGSDPTGQLDLGLGAGGIPDTVPGLQEGLSASQAAGGGFDFGSLFSGFFGTGSGAGAATGTAAAGTAATGTAAAAGTAALAGIDFGALFTSLLAVLALRRGAAINHGRVIPFAHGDVFDQATFSPMADGNTAMIGEDGPEGVLPLARGRDGKLGVKNYGGGGGGSGGTTNFYINTPNADSFRKTQSQIESDDKRRRNRQTVRSGN